MVAIGGVVMRMSRHNQRPLWYANLQDSDKSYVRDEDGNIIYMEVDGEQTPVETGGRTEEYTKPVKFYGTIQNAGGQYEAAAYGVSVGSYQARLLDVTDGLPLNEMSLIWVEEPQTAFGFAIPETADYRVVRKPLSTNQIVYLLKRNE